ncbi:TPA: hypothetical protein PIJ93_002698, partial [Staphylococcus aureus]|nr:hypothetical protein [Staphylococcus aureus]HDH0855269.1 hypothetical protein [Staphylococcus aureus]HDH5586811.1 hypothetical protein [Staphylococcus aureus]HDH5605609.1 hypothetical protein [Staphylococcus aureus]HDH5646365.1 hypothetical protein [Staphylococcus aureus]
MSIIQNNDITNHRLSEKVYTIKSKQKYVNIKTNNGMQTFKVQSSRIDKVNGFQAMAVSPKDSKGNVDNETVYFVYAGTDKY